MLYTVAMPRLKKKATRVHKAPRKPARPWDNPAQLIKGMDKYKLNARQTQFVINYLTCFNATKAAAASGYSPKTCHVQGSHLVRLPKVAFAIQDLLEGVGLSRDRLFKHLGKLVYGIDIADYEPWLEGEESLQELRGRGIDTSMLENATHSVTYSDKSRSERRQLKLPGKLDSIKVLAKLMGLMDRLQAQAPPVVLQMNFTQDSPPEKKEG